MKRLGFLAGLVFLACALPAALGVQYGVKTGNWTSFGGDNGSTRYSPLDQINRDNVRNLQVAWTFKTDNYAPSPVPQSQSTPLMVKGVLYFTAGPRRNVIALDAATGETIWVYRPDEGVRGDRAPRKNTRGLSWWTDGREDRIIPVAYAEGYAEPMRAAGDDVRVRMIDRTGHVELVAPEAEAWAAAVEEIQRMLHR